MSTLGLEPELFQLRHPIERRSAHRVPILTTGTFNLFVKDLNRWPPERGEFSPVPENARMRLLGCPRNSKKLNVLSSACQPIGLTGFPPVLHRGELDTAGGRKCPPCTARGALLSAIEHGFRLGLLCLFGRRRSGSSHLEKDLAEVPAKNAKTLRGSLSPNDNPVAGANFRGSILCP